MTIGTALLALAEDQWFDRKSFRVDPRRLAESLIGFANADGGTLAIGLSAGKVEGVDSDPRHLNALMQAAADFTEPPVITNSHLYECVRNDGVRDHLLLIEVPPARVVHASSRDDAYLRIGDENRRLTFMQRRELFYDKSQSAFESEPVGASVADIDRELLAAYATALHADDAIGVLAARGCSAGEQLTVAGLLLFGMYPERHLPSAQVRVCRFSGTRREYGSRQNLVSDARLEGPIPRLIEKVAEEVRRLQPTRRALAASGRFEQVGLVPEDAWLEGIVNAVVHRSYSAQGDQIHVDIYDDRILIQSPGRFPGLVDLAKPLEMTRYARNPRIARVCTDLRITQELGEGIRRMFAEMRAAGLADPMYHQTSASVELTLTAEATDRRLIERLPVMQQRLIALLRDADALSTGEVVDAIGAARPTVLRHLAHLRDAGYVDWLGKSRNDPRASWQLRR